MDPSLRMVLANNIIELRNTQPVAPRVVTVPPRIDLRLDRSKPLQRNRRLPLQDKGQDELSTQTTIVTTQQLPFSLQPEASQTQKHMPGWKLNTMEYFTGPSYVPTLFLHKPQVQKRNELSTQELTALAQEYRIQPLTPPVPMPPAPMAQELAVPTQIESGSKASFQLLPTGTQYKDKTTKSAYYSTDVKRHYINIDTRYRSNASVSTTTNFRWRFFQPMKNIVSLRIASVEIPNNAYSFSAVKQNISFQIKLTASANYTTITIPEGNYSTTEMEDAINAQIQAVDGGFTFAVSLVSGKSSFTHPTQQFNIIFPQINTDAVSDWGLGYNLGFTQPSYSNKTTLTSEQVVNFVGDIYYFLKIGDFEGVEHNREGQTRLAATAKIIANADKYSIIYDNGANFMTKQVDFPLPQNIASFDVSLVDSNNVFVDLLGGNWSCTLELVEILNVDLNTGFNDHLLKNFDTPR